MRVVTPRPPAFITGPASALLTNAPGYSARVEVAGPGAMPAEMASAGQLLELGTQLLYVPETEENTDAHRRPGGYSFIWDVAQGRGYVMSEALQAYAPLSSNLHITNVALARGVAAAQRVSGHPCEPANATVRMDDGTAAGFELWRAIDLNGFPVRIESATNANTFSLNISKVRFEQPPTNVFSPPDGFTAYATPEAMADELAARQNNLRRRNPEQMQSIPGIERGGRY